MNLKRVKSAMTPTVWMSNRLTSSLSRMASRKERTKTHKLATT